MNGEKNYLEEVKTYSNSYVTFGDGDRGRIKGICKLVSSGFHCLHDILVIEYLTANIINIKQLCDKGLNVNFKKS